jgi:hypothetical protein
MGVAMKRGGSLLETGIRYTVFSIRTTKNNETIWVKAGVAFVNRDHSMNLYLDVLPMEGKLHVRQTGEKNQTQNHASSEPATPVAA